jgi:hypothetical protein
MRSRVQGNKVGIVTTTNSSGNGFVPMSFRIVYDISVTLHVTFIVSRRIQLHSRNICFIYLLSRVQGNKVGIVTTTNSTYP